MSLSVHRIYEDPAPEGRRILVDRLWPRGVSKDEAGLDEWLKEAAPSTDLRRWYGHEVDRFEEFVRRYRAELGQPPGAEAAAHLLELAAAEPVILLTATKDVAHSGARVLCDHLISLQGQ